VLILKDERVKEMSDEEKKDDVVNGDGAGTQNASGTAVAETKTDEGTKNDAGQESWDQTRQYRDELSASNRREGEMKAKLDVLEQQKADAEAAATSANATEADLGDYDTLVDTVKTLRTELSETRSDRTAMQKQVTDIDEQIKQRDQVAAAERANSEGRKIFNDTVSDLGGKYGAEYTNAATAAADKMYIEQNIASIANVEARRSWIKTNLELEFIKAKNSKSAKSSDTDVSNKTNVVLDTGGGGGSPPPAGEIKEGSIDDVLSQLKDQWSKEDG